MKTQSFLKTQNQNFLCGLFLNKLGFPSIKPCKKLTSLFLVFFIISCSPNSGSTGSKTYKKPSCSSPSKAESNELEEKKRDLFQDIENSNKYANSKIREQSLKRYKHIIKTKEQTACHDDVIQFIDKISNLHRK